MQLVHAQTSTPNGGSWTIYTHITVQMLTPLLGSLILKRRAHVIILYPQARDILVTTLTDHQCAHNVEIPELQGQFFVVCHPRVGSAPRAPFSARGSSSRPDLTSFQSV